MKKEEVIYLFKEDLNKVGETESFEEINFRSFKEASLSNEVLNKANLIIYVCHKNYPRFRIIKSRHF